MTDTRPDGDVPGRAEEREPGRDARYRGFHDPSAYEQPADDAADPRSGGGRPPLPRRDTSGTGGHGPGAGGASGTGPGPGGSGGYGGGAGGGSGTYRPEPAGPAGDRGAGPGGHGAGPGGHGAEAGGYGAGPGGGPGTYEPEPAGPPGDRSTQPGGHRPGAEGYGAGAGGQDPLEQGHLPEYAHRNPLRGDPLPPPRTADAQPQAQSQSHAEQQYDPQSHAPPPHAGYPQSPQSHTPLPQAHVPRQGPADMDELRPRPLEPRPDSPTSATSRWFRPHTSPDAPGAGTAADGYAPPAGHTQGTPRTDPPAHPNDHHTGGYAPAPGTGPAADPHPHSPDDRRAADGYAPSAYSAQSTPRNDPAPASAPAPRHPDPPAPGPGPGSGPGSGPAAIVPQEGTSAQYPTSSYEAGPQPSAYAEAPPAAAYGQTTPAYDQHPASYAPQLLGYDQAPADPLGTPRPAATGDPLTDPLTDPLGTAAPTGRTAPAGDPLTDPLPGATPGPTPRRHAGRPAVEEQQPYPAPAYGRHAGGTNAAHPAPDHPAPAHPTPANPTPTTTPPANPTPAAGHRDPSPWGDLSAAAHAGAPGTADPATADPAPPQPGSATGRTTGRAPARTPGPATGPATGPPAAPANDQRLTWGTAPAARRRGIPGTEGRTEGRGEGRAEGRGDREDRTVQTMSLNVARALGTRMAARKAARAAKQQRTVLISRITGEAFITLGVLMLLFVVYQLWWTNVLADRESRQEAKQLEEQWERGEGPGKEDARDPGAFEAGEGFAIMHIPSLNVNRPVAQGIDSQKVLDRGLLGHYSEGDLKTAMPWDEKGNFAVAGHRNTHGEPFRYINKLEPGEEIVVETKDTYYIYEVANTLPSTSPSNTDVIDPVPPGSGFTEPGRYVTLTTCTPEYTSKYRLIVWGKMVEERPRSKGKPDALVD